MRCSSWSLGPSPCRPITVGCPRRRAETAFAHRGCIRNPTTPRSLLVLPLYVARTAKSDDLGHRILKSHNIPSDLALSDCVRRSFFFRSNLKIWGSESDGVGISLNVHLTHTYQHNPRKYQKVRFLRRLAVPFRP